MFGNVTALDGLHVTGKYRDISMQHTCSRHAAWDPHNHRGRGHVWLPLPAREGTCTLKAAAWRCPTRSDSQESQESQESQDRQDSQGSQDSQDSQDTHSYQFKNNYFTEMCSGSEDGSYLRLIDFCMTQL